MAHLVSRLSLPVLGFLLSIAAPAGASDRAALVIGNSAYRHVGALRNAVNDARAISAALRQIGFLVVDGYDLDADGMAQAIERFERALVTADVTLVYYSGHGIGVDGVNYLLPVDARLETRSALKSEAFSADWLLNDVMQGGERVSIVMLDACRNNPFSRSFSARTRSAVNSGLAEIRAKTGSYVAFATAPGDVASDGDGPNSPFTTAVLRHLATPALEIERMMKLVRREVYTDTGEDQLPWTSSALLGEFYFVPPAAEVISAAPAAPPPAAEPLDGGRTELKMTAIAPQQPTADELRSAALQRAETALLPTLGARRRAQEALAKLGFALGNADGRFGPSTRAAIRAFQAASARELTGYFDRVTLATLEQETARPAVAAAPATPKRPPPAEVATVPKPQVAVSLPGSTLGVCTAGGDTSWSSERHLTLAQCRKIGGTFRPF